MSAPVVVILAAGQGARMRSATPKLLHPLCGRPMIAWSVAAAREAGAGKIVVVDGPERQLEATLNGTAMLVVQDRPRGTADAVRSASAHIEAGATVIVLNGDVPLIAAATITGLARAHAGSGAAATIATAVLADPAGYGRVVRAPDGTVERVVENKAPGDATELELHIREVNTGIFAFEGRTLLAALEEVRSDNAQAELYLPDVLPIIRSRQRAVLAYEIADPHETLGVNDRAALAQVRAIAQQRIHRRHMLAGVTIVDPEATVIDVDVEIAADTTIGPFSSLHDATRIGAGARIGPLSTLIDCRVGDEATVLHSYAREAEIGDRVSVGPFAYLRPGGSPREGGKERKLLGGQKPQTSAGATGP
ncbi:MAG: bifunctional UDP-N-acetylglucosamine diphosphorylase/glucosamine-1-phosphate N-acetyltransferase GlmU, partial [Solirubrobacteraceae bacterium]